MQQEQGPPKPLASVQVTSPSIVEGLRIMSLQSANFAANPFHGLTSGLAATSMFPAC